jgi:hypothetical protein
VEAAKSHPHDSLFSGEGGQQLADVAPVIVELRQRSPFADQWLGEWGNSVGILVEAPVPMARVREHLRTLTIVRYEREKYFFRFYDPRVLRPYLPSCTRDEVSRFFGPMVAIYCEGDEPNQLMTFRMGRSGLESNVADGEVTTSSGKATS